LKIEIAIVDDDEWEPDLDFFVELYDPNKDPESENDRLKGDDTRCKVTIIDEDFPGTIAFELSDVSVHKSCDKVDVRIIRQDGSDGTISCMIKTENLSESLASGNAVEFEDYLPKHEKITF